MKIGCSLDEAFGTSWKQAIKFTEVPVQTFQNIIKDPYSSYGSGEAFEASDPNQFDIDYGWYGPELGAMSNRVSALEDKLVQIHGADNQPPLEEASKDIIRTSAVTEQIDTFGGDPESYISSLVTMFCEYVQTQEMENILLFILVVLFISNLMELTM